MKNSLITGKIIDEEQSFDEKEIRSHLMYIEKIKVTFNGKSILIGFIIFRKIKMGILEIIGELIKPGPTGRMDFGDRVFNEKLKYIPIRFAISLIIILLIEYYFVFRPEIQDIKGAFLKVNIFLLAYLLISYTLRIKPDYSNTGWIPFLINNPFRFSDNVNRFLAIIEIICYPGKYISRSIISFIKYCRG